MYILSQLSSSTEEFYRPSSLFTLFFLFLSQHTLKPLFCESSTFRRCAFTKWRLSTPQVLLCRTFQSLMNAEGGLVDPLIYYDLGEACRNMTTRSAQHAPAIKVVPADDRRHTFGGFRFFIRTFGAHVLIINPFSHSRM